MISIKKAGAYDHKDNTVILTDGNVSKLDLFNFTKQESDYIKAEFSDKKTKQVLINRYKNFIYLVKIEANKDSNKSLESTRKSGAELSTLINKSKIAHISVVDMINDSEHALALTEGLILASYQFNRYKKDPKTLQHSLKSISVISKVSSKEIEELEIVLDAVYHARDLVNEPVSYLTATQLSKEITTMGKEAGFKVEVFNKNKIEALKMGGLLAVNRGSQDPPTFNILEYKPKKAKNTQPVILVGKGVVYDTGGLSLKPTPNSMDMMKSDMAGAAAVAATLYAVAMAELPVHVIGLIPATDNRPGEKAYTPGDVITMYSGLTVEVLNTDAEGRLILGDALSYADKYKPELVIDLATLTGAAVAAIGPFGTVAMGKGDNKMSALKTSGERVYERLAEMPFWDEYDELIKSDVAEIKNLGGPYGGAITAGKFLGRFTNYPWVHLDIAGPAFLTANDSYRLKGGTGVGVRLLFDFLKNY